LPRTVTAVEHVPAAVDIADPIGGWNTIAILTGQFVFAIVTVADL